MAGGNRARFVPSQTLQNTPSTSGGAEVNLDHKNDANFQAQVGTTWSTLPKATSTSTSSEPDTGANSLVPFSKQKSVVDTSNSPCPGSDCSDDEIIAQRTRTTEIETLYKAKKERSGKLNISGLIKRKDSGAKSTVSIPQGASIQEVLDDDDLEARSPGQHSNQRLITKSSSHSASDSAHFSPPSNQLAAQKVTSSRQLIHNDASTQDAPIRSDSNNPHRLSKDEKIKGLTTAFNRKHSTASRAAPRYASPIQNFSHPENNRAHSPHVGLEDGPSQNAASMGMRGWRNGRHESQSFDMEPDMDELEDDSYKMIEQSGGTREGLSHYVSHEKRGEKRSSGSDVEDVYANQTGKRARTETYDEPEPLHNVNSRMTNSPEPNARIDRPNSSDLSDIQGQFSGRDPQLKFFLGRDVDEYISAHMDRYEASRKRWAECSREEWEKGADELVEKFTEVLDFVKDHVKRKVTLFASLHAKIDEHQKERAQTAEMLKEAKSKLVAKTGVVVDEG